MVKITSDIVLKLASCKIEKLWLEIISDYFVAFVLHITCLCTCISDTKNLYPQQFKSNISNLVNHEIQV